MRFATVLAGLALVVAMAATPSAARSAGQAMPGMGMMGGDCPMMSMMHGGMRGDGMMDQGMMGQSKMGQGHGMMMRRHGGMAPMVEGRLAYLEAALEITEAQKAAWDGYASAVRDRVQVMQTMRQSMMEAMQEGSAVDRMNARITGMETMLAAMKEVAPATETLYAALNDDQKKLADELIGGGCGAF